MIFPGKCLTLQMEEDTVRTNQVPNTPLRGADPIPSGHATICLRTWCGALGDRRPLFCCRPSCAVTPEPGGHVLLSTRNVAPIVEHKV
jgi:hypothetical protein